MPRSETIDRRREFERIQADLTVRMEVGGKLFDAQARNLSMVGLFVETPLRIPGKSHVPVRIPLPGADGDIATTCRIERREEEGLALSFSEISWDDLLAVARFVSPQI